MLYGDLTGQSAVARTGAVFENISVDAGYVARTILTYLTLPTEYLRNSIRAPTWVDLLAVALGVLVLAGLVHLAFTWRSLSRAPLRLAVMTAGLSFVAWLAEITVGWPVAFRTAYGVLPLIAIGVGSLGSVRFGRLPQGAVLILTLGLSLSINAWGAAALHP